MGPMGYNLLPPPRNGESNGKENGTWNRNLCYTGYYRVATRISAWHQVHNPEMYDSIVD